MGYRNYLGFISKKDYNSLKSKSLNELRELAREKLVNDGTEYDEDDLDYDIGYYLVTPKVTEIYNMGKGVSLSKEMEKHKKKFFLKKESNSLVDNSDTEFVVVNKEFFKYIIEMYQGFIQEHYKTISNREMYRDIIRKTETEYCYNDTEIDIERLKEGEQFTELELNALIKCFANSYQQSIEWNMGFTPVNLDESKDKITGSCRYEYSIFELVRLYKTFDWKNNILLFYGH